MPQPAITKERVTEILSQLYTAGYPHCTLEEAARQIGLQRNTASHYVNEFARRFGIEVLKPGMIDNQIRKAYQGRLELRIDNGVVIPFSDAHYWPGEASTAHRALLECIKEFTPRLVVANGDMFDGASISRFPRVGWQNAPTVKQELEAVTERLAEVEVAARHAHKVWCLGNHDARFETFLAANAPQYEGMPGFHLKDHFPAWLPSWSLHVNNTLAIKHRWRGGIHAARNNAIHGGMSVCTGHLHTLVVAPVTDYNGTRWGIDCGTLADFPGPQFTDYTEDNCTGWRSGFPVLTFRQGRLMQPELVQVLEPGVVMFRGKTYCV